MVEESISLRIEAITKDSGKTTWCMVKDSFSLTMEKYNIKESGQKINLMDGDYSMLLVSSINHRPGHITKVKWRMDRWMVGVNCGSSTELYSKANFKTVRYSDVDVVFNRMVRWYKRNGSWNQ